MEGKVIFGILANIIGVYIIYKIFFAPVKVDMSSLYEEFINSVKNSVVKAKVKIFDNEILIEGENVTTKLELQLIHKSKKIHIFVFAQNIIHGKIDLKLNFSHGFDQSKIYNVVETALQAEMVKRVKNQI